MGTQGGNAPEKLFAPLGKMRCV